MAEKDIREWKHEDGPLTEEIIQALEDAAGQELYGMGVLIANDAGIYVAPKGAKPGKGEWYFDA